MTTTQNAESQAAMTPARALEILLEGNQRFRSNRRLERDLARQVRDTAAGQWPFAVVLSCIDSRAPAELVFDTGVGDIFNVRIAGNCVNEDVLGSIEFACKVAGARLVVVMGHTSCGAIKGACDDVQLGHLSGLLGKLRPAVEAVTEPSNAAERTSKNASFVDTVAHENVACALAALRTRSAVLRELDDEGAIALVGAVYDVATGAVDVRR